MKVLCDCSKLNEEVDNYNTNKLNENNNEGCVTYVFDIATGDALADIKEVSLEMISKMPNQKTYELPAELN
jgi:hypothetical protein